MDFISNGGHTLICCNISCIDLADVSNTMRKERREVRWENFNSYKTIIATMSENFETDYAMGECTQGELIWIKSKCKSNE